MKLIAHRGNTKGPNPAKENSPNYIDNAIMKGYDVEVDVRIESWGVFFLGHDSPEYEVPLEWLEKRSKVLWIHCKNIEALGWFNSQKDRFRYFWHQEDDYTLTSCGKIWTYPNKRLYSESICVMPENGFQGDLESCYGLCSDIVSYYKHKT